MSRYNWDSQPLGEMPDTSLAQKLGVHQSTVTKARKRRGIPRSDLLCLTTEGEAANQEEALIDLYWHEQDISHDFQVKIGPYIADWVINGDTVVEYGGFLNHPKFGESYRVRLEAKVAFYKEQGWKVKIISPSNLSTYDTGLPPRFKDQSCCSKCGKRFGSRDGVRGGKVRKATTFLCDPCWSKDP